MSNKFPNSGRLNYSRNKVHPKSPDMFGELVLTREFMKSLLEATDEDDIAIKLDAWQQDGNYGPWFSIKVNTYKKPAPQGETTPLTVGQNGEIDDSDIPF